MKEETTPEAVVGRRVKALREARGWSQQELAMRMADTGFSWRQTTVAKTEGADRPIRVNELVHLAAIFGSTVCGLLGSGGHEAELRTLASSADEHLDETLRRAAVAAEELAEAGSKARQLIAEMGHLQSEETP